uniref:Uncharacterized protein n=1 Tax=Haptolina brevifila TaxID=156173 RepID=A0A7S2DCS2_9EUKA|mmetsp:Transcript_36568/g.72850  ORF Transcript_36568/g.72850 Transcript_36568/m.72850 type:complete len:586 (+) Transcript_36568:1314-3071(+)
MQVSWFLRFVSWWCMGLSWACIVKSRKDPTINAALTHCRACFEGYWMVFVILFTVGQTTTLKAAATAGTDRHSNANLFINLFAGIRDVMLVLIFYGLSLGNSPDPYKLAPPLRIWSILAYCVHMPIVVIMPIPILVEPYIGASKDLVQVMVVISSVFSYLLVHLVYKRARTMRYTFVSKLSRPRATAEAPGVSVSAPRRASRRIAPHCALDEHVDEGTSVFSRDAAGSPEFEDSISFTPVRGILESLPHEQADFAITPSSNCITAEAGHAVHKAVAAAETGYPVKSIDRQFAARRTTIELVKACDLPPWYEPYPLILSGYRVNSSYRAAFLSLFQLHNETLNVYTELIPAMGFAVWIALFFQKHSQLSSEDHLMVSVAMICSCIVRPLCSALAHLLAHTSAHSYRFWWSVDYSSISLAVLMLSLVSSRFAFYCDQSLWTVFCISAVALFLSTVISILVVASPAVVSLSSGVRSRVRTSLFIIFILFCNGVPFIYQLAYSTQLRSASINRYLAFWGASLATFALGCALKSWLLVERIFNSTTLISSHTLWHIILNAAFVLAPLLGWDEYLTWRYLPENRCPSAHTT